MSTIIPLIPPYKKRPLPEEKPKSLGTTLEGYYGTIVMTFTFRTTILVGAVLQSLLVLFLPTTLAITPAIVALGIHFIDAVLVAKGDRPNPYLENKLKKVTAMVPDADGEFRGPGKEKVAVLLLGAKCNHPMGAFAPKFDDFSQWLTAMIKGLEDPKSQENGFLGISPWNRTAPNGGTEIVTISYWRSLQDVHNYAHSDEVHKKAWKWWEDNVADLEHIGIMHEVFEAPAGMWEGIYINFQPMLLGATTFLKKGDTMIGGSVDDAWISPLVDARKGRLRTSNGRRGQTGKMSDEDVFGKNAYA
ncbi:hypothetical protein B7463_g2098, partial [Scytalidium lignicola]